MIVFRAAFCPRQSFFRMFHVFGENCGRFTLHFCPKFFTFVGHRRLVSLFTAKAIFVDRIVFRAACCPRQSFFRMFHVFGEEWWSIHFAHFFGHCRLMFIFAFRIFGHCKSIFFCLFWFQNLQFSFVFPLMTPVYVSFFWCSIFFSGVCCGMFNFQFCTI